MDANDRALSILGLERDTSSEEIAQRYRDLALVWHPDRVGIGDKIRRKAEERMKEINWAYARLIDYRPVPVTETAPSSSRTEASQRRKSTGSATSEATSSSAPKKSRKQNSVPILVPAFRIPIVSCLVVLIVALSCSLAIDRMNQSDTTHEVADIQKPAAPAALEPQPDSPQPDPIVKIDQTPISNNTSTHIDLSPKAIRKHASYAKGLFTKTEPKNRAEQERDTRDVDPEESSAVPGFLDLLMATLGDANHLSAESLNTSITANEDFSDATEIAPNSFDLGPGPSLDDYQTTVGYLPHTHDRFPTSHSDIVAEVQQHGNKHPSESTDSREVLSNLLNHHVNIQDGRDLSSKLVPLDIPTEVGNSFAKSGLPSSNETDWSIPDWLTPKDRDSANIGSITRIAPPSGGNYDLPASDKGLVVPVKSQLTNPLDINVARESFDQGPLSILSPARKPDSMQFRSASKPPLDTGLSTRTLGPSVPAFNNRSPISIDPDYSFTCASPMVSRVVPPNIHGVDGVHGPRPTWNLPAGEFGPAQRNVRAAILGGGSYNAMQPNKSRQLTNDWSAPPTTFNSPGKEIGWPGVSFSTP